MADGKKNPGKEDSRDGDDERGWGSLPNLTDVDAEMAELAIGGDEELSGDGSQLVIDDG